MEMGYGDDEVRVSRVGQWEDMQGGESWYIVWLVKCMEKVCVKAGLLDPDHPDQQNCKPNKIIMVQQFAC